MGTYFADSYLNTCADALNPAIGSSGTLEIRTGSMPANCAASTTGTLLGSITLPSSPFAAASGGVVAKTGTWEDPTANASGDAGYYRIFNGATCINQGEITATGGGGKMTVAAIACIAGNKITITGFVHTVG